MATTAGSRRAEILASGFSFLEGPRWHEGRLYVSDFFDKVVRSFAADGTFQVACEVEAQPSGLGFLPTGEMLAVSMRDWRILALGPDGLTTYADLSGDCSWARLAPKPTLAASAARSGADWDRRPCLPGRRPCPDAHAREMLGVRTMWRRVTGSGL